MKNMERRSPIRKARHLRGIRLQRFYRRNRISALAIKRQKKRLEPSAATPLQPKQAVQLIQLDLLQAEPVESTKRRIKRRFVGKKSAPSHAKKGLQYKLPFWKGVKGKARSRTYKGRCFEEAGNELVVFHSTEQGYREFLEAMLNYVPREIAAMGARDSNRIAEIVAWISRRDTDDPFAFQECCAAVGVHPDSSEEAILGTIRELYGKDFDHYRVMRNNVIDAEYGVQQAVDWVLSDSNVGMSFNACCRALGFNPKKARAQVQIPEHMIPVDHEDEDTVDIDGLAQYDESQIDLSLG